MNYPTQAKNRLEWATRHPPKGASKYITVILPECGSISIRRKSERLRGNPKRGIGFEEAALLPSLLPGQPFQLAGQHRAIGWVDERLYTLIFEVREERTLYEEHS